jgi:hypothetical protein
LASTAPRPNIQAVVRVKRNPRSRTEVAFL